MSEPTRRQLLRSAVALGGTVTVSAALGGLAAGAASPAAPLHPHDDRRADITVDGPLAKANVATDVTDLELVRVVIDHVPQ